MTAFSETGQEVHSLSWKSQINTLAITVTANQNFHTLNCHSKGTYLYLASILAIKFSIEGYGFLMVFSSRTEIVISG